MRYSVKTFVHFQIPRKNENATLCFKNMPDCIDMRASVIGASVIWGYLTLSQYIRSHSSRWSLQS